MSASTSTTSIWGSDGCDLGPWPVCGLFGFAVFSYWVRQGLKGLEEISAADPHEALAADPQG